MTYEISACVFPRTVWSPDYHHSFRHTQLLDPKLSQMKSTSGFTTHSSLYAEVLKLMFRFRDTYFSQIILFHSITLFIFIGSYITNNSS